MLPVRVARRCVVVSSAQAAAQGVQKCERNPAEVTRDQQGHQHQEHPHVQVGKPGQPVGPQRVESEPATEKNQRYGEQGQAEDDPAGTPPSPFAGERAQQAMRQVGMAAAPDRDEKQEEHKQL
jgi:hypothetical protein